MSSKTKTFKYVWTEEIWAIHLEVRNALGVKGTLFLDYTGSDYDEEYPISTDTSMRYNVCRHSKKNTHILIKLPSDCELLLFENLDRAFYTTDPSTLELVEG